MSSVTGDGVHTTAGPDTSQMAKYSIEEERKGSSWILFATVLLAMEAVLNAVWGIAAIGQSHFFVGNAHYVFSDLKTWGWITVAFAALQGLAALSISRGGQFGRWFGIAIASLAIIGTMMSMQAAPFWGLALIAIYVVVIYGLAVYGGKSEFAL